MFVFVITCLKKLDQTKVAELETSYFHSCNLVANKNDVVVHFCKIIRLFLLICLIVCVCNISDELTSLC